MTRQTATFAVFLTVLAGCSATYPQQESGFMGEISVVDVVDGNTILITSRDNGPTVNARLVGYDAPETVNPGCSEELILGQSATQRLQVILHSATRIEPLSFGSDRYNRPLLRLVVDGRDLADTMISEGLAVPYDGGRRINWCQKLAKS